MRRNAITVNRSTYQLFLHLSGSLPAVAVQSPDLQQGLTQCMQLARPRFHWKLHKIPHTPQSIATKLVPPQWLPRTHSKYRVSSLIELLTVVPCCCVHTVVIIFFLWFSLSSNAILVSLLIQEIIRLDTKWYLHILLLFGMGFYMLSFFKILMNSDNYNLKKLI